MQPGTKLATLTLWMVLFVPCCADQKTTAHSSIDWDQITSDNVPVELKIFWAPIRTNWQQGLYQGTESNERSLKAISHYCVSYSQQHRDATQIRFMILDLSQHPSEFRAITYGIVVVHWDRKQIRSLLDTYSSRGTPAEKVAANDFIADIEEFDRSR